MDHVDRPRIIARLEAELDDWKEKERAAQQRAWRASQDRTATWPHQKLLKEQLASLRADHDALQMARDEG